MAKKNEAKQAVQEAPAPTPIAVHDVVQIVDDTHPWFPGFLVVTELKSWGIQGYALIIQSNAVQDNGQAYNRLKFEQIERIGKSAIISKHHEEAGDQD